MKFKPDALITATLVICTLVTTGLVIHREMFPSAATHAAGAQVPIMIHDWRAYLEKGTRLGPLHAKVQLIEFADFECPFCGSFYQTLKTIRERYPTEVSLAYIHFPIPGHRFALPAARVAECAGNQGRFEAMYNELFGGQEAFGLKPWYDYATAAGVPDLAAFDACIKKSDPIAKIEAGKELGTKLDVLGTPTLIVNGWKLVQPPTAEELDGMVKAVLAGKSPITPRKS